MKKQEQKNEEKNSDHEFFRHLRRRNLLSRQRSLLAGLQTAPVTKGEKIGEIQYQVNGEIWKTEEVVAGESVEEIDYSWCLEQTMDRWAKGGK